MPGKKSTSPPSPSTSSAQPRPFAFIVAVVAAATISTWHWYRPLPKQATQAANNIPVDSTSTITSDLPKARTRWKDSGLIFPSDDTAANNKTQAFNGSGSKDAVASQSLTGPQDIALQPMQDRSRPLEEWIGKDPLPMVPVEPALGAGMSLPKPTLWTNAMNPLPMHGATRTEGNADASSMMAQSPAGVAATPSPQGTASLPSGNMAFGGAQQHGSGYPTSSAFTPSGTGSPNSSLASDAPSPFRTPSLSSTSKQNRSTDPKSLVTNVWPDQGYDPDEARRRQELLQREQMKQSIAQESTANALHSVSNNRIRTRDKESDGMPNALQGVPNVVPSPDASAPRKTTTLPGAAFVPGPSVNAGTPPVATPGVQPVTPLQSRPRSVIRQPNTTPTTNALGSGNR